MEAQSNNSVFAQKWFINIKIKEKEELSVCYRLLTGIALKDYRY